MPIRTGGSQTLENPKSLSATPEFGRSDLNGLTLSQKSRASLYESSAGREFRDLGQSGGQRIPRCDLDGTCLDGFT